MDKALKGIDHAALVSEVGASLLEAQELRQSVQALLSEADALNDRLEAIEINLRPEGAIDGFGKCPYCDMQWGHDSEGQRYSHIEGIVKRDKIDHFMCPNCRHHFKRGEVRA